MKLNLTREQWAADKINNSWGWQRKYYALQDLATLFAENEAKDRRIAELEAEKAELDQAWLNAEAKITDLEAESARWKAARDECERQFQDKVRELNTLVDWQLLAAELAEALERIDGWDECLDTDNRDAASIDFEMARAALHRYQTRESGE